MARPKVTGEPHDVLGPFEVHHNPEQNAWIIKYNEASDKYLNMFGNLANLPDLFATRASAMNLIYDLVAGNRLLNTTPVDDSFKLSGAL